MTGDMPFDQEVFGEQLRDTRCGSATMNSIYYKLQYVWGQDLELLTCRDGHLCVFVMCCEDLVPIENDET